MGFSRFSINSPHSRGYNIDMKTFKIFLSFSFLLLIHPAFAKERKQDTTEYQSAFDDSVTFHKMTYLPSIDNVNGVYAKAVDVRMEELIKANHKWNYVQSHIAGSILKPEELVAEKTRKFHFTFLVPKVAGLLLKNKLIAPRITRKSFSLLSIT